MRRLGKAIVIGIGLLIAVAGLLLALPGVGLLSLGLFLIGRCYGVRTLKSIPRRLPPPEIVDATSIGELDDLEESTQAGIPLLKEPDPQWRLRN